MRWKSLTWVLVFALGWSMGWFGRDTPTDKHPDNINQVYHLVLIEPSTTDRLFHIVRVCNANTKDPEERAFLRGWQGWKLALFYEGRVLVMCIEE